MTKGTETANHVQTFRRKLGRALADDAIVKVDIDCDDGNGGEATVRFRVADMRDTMLPANERARIAAEIVRRWNAHDDLLAACDLRQLDPMHHYGPNTPVSDSYPVTVTLTMGDLRRIASAIAAAKGGAA